MSEYYVCANISLQNLQIPTWIPLSALLPPTHIHSSASKDILAVTSYLTPLGKSEIKTLGQLLGLRSVTVTDKEDSSKSVYLDSVITAWLNKQDDVISEGRVLYIHDSATC